jgi:hypothetical protein
MSALTNPNFSPAQPEDRFETNGTRSRWRRQGIFILAVALPLAVAACAGSAGLDIGPVDHSCHGNPGRGHMSGGSGCDGDGGRHGNGSS